MGLDANHDQAASSNERRTTEIQLRSGNGYDRHAPPPPDEMHQDVAWLLGRVAELESENVRYVSLAGDLWNVENIVENAASEIASLRRALSRKRED